MKSISSSGIVASHPRTSRGGARLRHHDTVGTQSRTCREAGTHRERVELADHCAGGSSAPGPVTYLSSDLCDIGDDLPHCGLLSATISGADGVPTADSSRWSKQVGRG